MKLSTKHSSTPLSSSSMKSVLLAKDNIPVALLSMESMRSPSWQKSASFNSLQSAANSFAEIYPIPDIISIIRNELPIDSSSAFQEAPATSISFCSTNFNIDYLSPIRFLHKNGKLIQFDFTLTSLSKCLDQYFCSNVTFILSPCIPIFPMLTIYP